MSGVVPPSSVAYWRDKFGIDSLADMRRVVDSVLAGGLPFGNLGANQLFAFEAYSQPYSPAGLAVLTYLRRVGYSGDTGTALQGVVDTLSQIAAQLLQEAAMATLVIPNAFQVTIQGANGDVAVDNVLGVVNPAGSASGAAAAVKSAWEASGGPADNLNAQYTVSGYKAVDLGSVDGDIATLDSTKTGGGSGSISTAAACALISWNGSTRSRSTRGRLYYGPLGEGAINADGRTLDSTVASDIESFFGDFLTSLSGAGYPLAVLSRTLQIATPVTSHVVEPVIATQRRRIRGR